MITLGYEILYYNYNDFKKINLLFIMLRFIVKKVIIVNIIDIFVVVHYK